MIKYISAFLVAAMLAISPASAATCIAGSYEDFRQYTDKNNFQVHELQNEDLKKLLAYINNLRLSKNIFALEADTFQFAVIDRQRKLVGTIMFKDGCVVPGTVIVVTFADFSELLEAAGVELEKGVVLIRNV